MKASYLLAMTAALCVLPAEGETVAPAPAQKSAGTDGSLSHTSTETALLAVSLPSDFDTAHVEWCLERYRSYNPRDNTWVSYSGRVRQCDSPFW